MANTRQYRAFVTSRAGGACEYCRLVQEFSGNVFHIEHVVPKSLGGATSLDNLALSCSGCNLAKGPPTGMKIAGNAVETAFFNPRNYSPSTLGWHLHFNLDRESGIIYPISDRGIATIQGPDMNSDLRVRARQWQWEAGVLR